MRAFLLCAGRGTRFLPVTSAIPKPLFPFLNVPLVRAHLMRLREAGVEEAGLNLHHRGGEIVRELSQGAADLPKLRFFEEPTILGTAGGLRNAAAFLREGDFVTVNPDAVLEADYAGLLRAHRLSGRAATLLLVENEEPERLTPVSVVEDRIVAFGKPSSRSYLYTGVAVLSGRLLDRIPERETSLVADLWRPMLEEGVPIGMALHRGPFADLGRPRDFLRATLEALERGGPFPAGSGTFDPDARVLSLRDRAGFEARSAVLGRARIGPGSVVSESAVWNGASVGQGVRLRRVLVAGGEVPDGASHEEALLWAETGATARVFPL